MMAGRKRTRAQAEAEEAAQTGDGLDEQHDEPPPVKKEKKEGLGLLDHIRNTWEFASLMQYIHLFGKVVKIDESFDVVELETECLKVGSSEKLAEIGLALLKFVSSHRGLTPEIFDEYTRRQYVAKAPSRNPYGTDEEPKKFADFDTFLKLRVLHQLSVWTLHNPDRIRERMGELDETQWRIEELGYDRHERLYFVLDDNRLYRRTNPPVPSARAAKPKANTKKAQAARRRASQRRRASALSESCEPQTPGDENNGEDNKDEHFEDDTDTFGGFKWECLAVTLEEYQDFLESLRKTKDADEKVLRDRLTEHVLPVIEKAADDQRKKAIHREREMLNLEKLATAKRSSRLADKHEKEQHEREAVEAKRKYEADVAEAIKDQARKERMEQDRQSRMETREQRIKDREQKRLLREREVEMMAQREKELESGEARMSERRLKAELAKRKKDLEELEQEEDWTFDCSSCGVYGKNADDGSHSIACENCSVWQHSKCLGISPSEAEKDDFHFVCQDCKRKEVEEKLRKEEDERLRKIKRIKFNMGSSSSPPDRNSSVNGSPAESKKRKAVGDIKTSPNKIFVNFKHVAAPPPPPNFNLPASAPRPNINLINAGRPLQQNMMNDLSNGPRLSPQGQQVPPPNQPHPYQNGVYGRSPIKMSSPSTHHSPMANGHSPSPSHQPLQNRPEHFQGVLNRPPYTSPSQTNGAGSYQNFQQYTPSRSQGQVNNSARPTSSHGQQSQVPRPLSSHGPSPYARPSLQPSQLQNMSPATVSAPAPTASAMTLPSPIQNRPSMSPTQGYYTSSVGKSPTKPSPPPAVPQYALPSPVPNGTLNSTINLGISPVLPPIMNLAPSPKLPPFNPPPATFPSPVKTTSPDNPKEHSNLNGNGLEDRS